MAITKLYLRLVLPHIMKKSEIVEFTDMIYARGQFRTLSVNYKYQHWYLVEETMNTMYCDFHSIMGKWFQENPSRYYIEEVSQFKTGYKARIFVEDENTAILLKLCGFSSILGVD